MFKTCIADTDDACTIMIPRDFFEGACIVETASQYTGICHFSYDVMDDEIAVHISSKSGSPIHEIANDFINDLTDHQAYRELNKECGHIRDLIVEQSFAPLKNV